MASPENKVLKLCWVAEGVCAKWERDGIPLVFVNPCSAFRDRKGRQCFLALAS